MSGGKLCGVGIPGELCIAGESLTSGYLNRPELSAENLLKTRLVQDNFIEVVI